MLDLRSDTLSMPTEEMLKSIQTAQLGDDSRDGDPTVLELEALAAEMLGKESALLTVSGTMSNILAIRTHTQPGATVIVEQSAHLYLEEFQGAAAVCGAMLHPLPGRLGAIDVPMLTVALRRVGTGFPTNGLLCLENTHNGAGGTVLSPAATDEYCKLAHARDVPVHLDGARLFNAAVALGTDARELTRSVDSVSVCLSKGLSAPVGSLLAGPRPFIDRARAVRRALGGTMRQAGIIAAPGLIGLRTMVERLDEDHQNARFLAEGISTIAGLHVNLESVQTNIVRVDVGGLGIDAATFGKHLAAQGLRGLPNLTTGIRFVTYRGIGRADVERALNIIRKVVATRPWANA
jgi:threonine aldolase